MTPDEAREALIYLGDIDSCVCQAGPLAAEGKNDQVVDLMFKAAEVCEKFKNWLANFIVEGGQK